MIHDRLYKITDFGLAKVINTLYDKLAMSFKGTPLYMAPEMIKEEAKPDPKVDMWSLGVILFRMMYGGVYPFLVGNKKYTRDTAFQDILLNPLVFPKSPQRSQKLIDLVSRMLEKDPKKRLSWEELFASPDIDICDSLSDMG